MVLARKFIFGLLGVQFFRSVQQVSQKIEKFWGSSD